MSSVMFLLFAYFVSSILGDSFGNFMPNDNANPDWQCWQKGYSGMCHEPMVNRYKICLQMTCANKKLPNGKYSRSPSIGPAVEGSFCGYTQSGDHKICHKKKCRPMSLDHKSKYGVQYGKLCTKK